MMGVQWMAVVWYPLFDFAQKQCLLWVVVLCWCYLL